MVSLYRTYNNEWSQAFDNECSQTTPCAYRPSTDDKGGIKGFKERLKGISRYY